ncbi:type II toxin-antitoxin system VapC family toxin [Gryllotalpicola ginsengisoli]|uniref:type II toxin-antitoxin system VapC family toxin n=1 Tax=Gryllotalpicola ginsengisoli TaxID=444608 RepID=UPI0003B4165C|nr:type II toxin-antitoxin system VapC family toxin [Gryllotalpicola ginsengisoli]
MVHYLDTSALVKFVIDEPGSAALREWAARSDVSLISSDLARTELLRAVRRVHPDRAALAHTVLERIDLLHLTAADFDAAGRIGPDELRFPDALHLVAALALGDDLETMVVYDERLASAAQLNGVTVSAPGLA